MVVNINSRKNSQKTGMELPTEKSFDVMNAIARGVQLKLGINRFSKMITYETINLARRLQIDKEEIQKWVAGRCDDP